MPQQNGSAIMLPADITTIAGSDFDVDKLFLMIPEFEVIDIDWKQARYDFAFSNAVFKEFMTKFTNSELAQEFLNDEPPSFKEWWSKQDRSKYRLNTPIIRKVRYNMNKTPQEQSRKARNNALIDISYSILTNSDTARKLLSPGNFEEVKRVARMSDILTDKELLDKYALENSISIEKATGKVRKASTKELSNFVKKYKKLPNPLSLDTFVYFHKQNMTGGALIGAYANNTTAQAKFQNTKIAIKDDYKFSINGRWIQSLHDVVSPLNQLVSKNCAEFSAASVDDVKDPVLASLGQTRDTAKVTALMLRAGMSIEEIGLIFAQPTIKNTSLQQVYLKELEELGADTKFKDVLQKDYTTEMLINNIVDAHKEASDFTSTDRVAFLKNNIYVSMLMEHITAMAINMHQFSKISRADSPNNAVAISIAGAKNQVQAVKLWHRNTKLGKNYFVGTSDLVKHNMVSPNMSKDHLRKALNNSSMPMLQAFYTLGIEFATKLTAPFFIQTEDYVNNLVDQLYANSPRGIIRDDVLNRFYKELVVYGLTKTEIFGDTEEYSMEQKKNYYLNSFPNKFLEILSNNPDIANLGIMRKISVKDGKIVMSRSGRMTQTMRDSYMRDFDNLLYMNNPEASRLALDLFIYSYYNEGLNFGPNNYGYFFSPFFMNSVSEYVDTLRGMKYDMYEGGYFDKFLIQFYANHFDAWGLLPQVNGESVDSLEDGSIMVDSSVVTNINTGVTSFYPYITVEGKDAWYMLDRSKSSKEKAVYTEALFKGNSFNPVYNANKELEELENSVTNESKVRYKGFEEELPEVNSENPITDYDDYLDSIASFLQTQETDPYNEEEGENQLDEKLCKI